jgi:hypothetical protein
MNAVLSPLDQTGEIAVTEPEDPKPAVKSEIKPTKYERRPDEPKRGPSVPRI